MIRKYLLPFLAIVGLGAAIFMIIQGNRTVSVVPPVVQSRKRHLPPASSAQGSWRPAAKTSRLALQFQGLSLAIHVKWGDRVKAGAPLFKVDTRDLEAQLLPANAKVKEMEAQLLPATAKVNEAEATAAKAENRLKVGEGLEPGVSISAEEMANRRFDTAINKAMVGSGPSSSRANQIPDCIRQSPGRTD